MHRWTLIVLLVGLAPVSLLLYFSNDSVIDQRLAEKNFAKSKILSEIGETYDACFHAKLALSEAVGSKDMTFIKDVKSIKDQYCVDNHAN